MRRNFRIEKAALLNRLCDLYWSDESKLLQPMTQNPFFSSLLGGPQGPRSCAIVSTTGHVGERMVPRVLALVALDVAMPHGSSRAQNYISGNDLLKYCAETNNLPCSAYIQGATDALVTVQHFGLLPR